MDARTKANEAFNKELQDRFRNGEVKDWTCHLCGQKQSEKVQLKTDRVSLVWCTDCIQKSLMTPAVKYSQRTPGRNEPCFCTSGKKYKHCHGKKGG